MATAAVASSQRVEPGSYKLPIANFDAVKSPKPRDSEVKDTAREWTDSFNHALKSQDYDKVASHFAPESYWRSHLALAWDFTTLKGPEQIASFFNHSKQGCRLKSIAIDDGSSFKAPQASSFDAADTVNGIQTFLTTETDVGSGHGVVRLVQTDGKWKAFTLFTSMTELRGYEETISGRRPRGVAHGGQPGRKNWQEKRNEDSSFENSEPEVLIVGAGQGGLTPAARLKMLGVPTLVIDQNERVGDNWRQRYHHLVLHDPVWYDHMPYIKFPPHWPVFSPKDKLAEFFESYAKLLELNIWTSTTITSSSWSDKDQRWTITLERKQTGKIETRTFHPRHVVQATGHSGEKSFPHHIKGINGFKGDVLCHSSEFAGAKPESKGKKAVVVGCCNSGHDIAQDYYEKGYDVTMVQRSSTCVISSEAILEIGLAGLYDETGPDTEDADIFFHSLPAPVLKGLHVAVTKAQNERDKAVLTGLTKAGFKLDQGPDDAGLFMKYFQRGGGYYIDVGASNLIVDGKIKIKQGQEIQEVLPHAIKFQDGTELEADEIIFATGYKNMRSQSRQIFGDEVADRVKDVWGFDEQGEMRTIWRKSGHPGFWFFGGNLALCRYYSRMLALQIKALEEGICKYEDP